MQKFISHLWTNKATTGLGLGGSGFLLYDEIDSVTDVRGGIKLALKVLLFLGMGGMAQDPGFLKKKKVPD